MRLIDAEQLLEQIPAVKNWDEKVSLLGVTADFINLICDAPTIEAKPVVHAHWIKDDDGKYYCHNCGYPAEGNITDYAEWCPVCGAQMDEFAGDINVGSKKEEASE